MERKVTQNRVLCIVIAFMIVLLGFVIGMNIKNTRDARAILEESVRSQLISISLAAREILDVDAFAAYNSEQDVRADQENYDETLRHLRQLASDVGAEYIYALKEVDGAYVFVFDTDPVDEAIFVPYELSPVHERALEGRDAADIMNVDDDYGSFNTGAVPILQDGRVVGIISADIEDTYLARSARSSLINTVVLIAALVAIMAVLLVILIRQLRRIRAMQQRLTEMAHYDTITGLPNRQYLLDYLAAHTGRGDAPPFALFFIDLDNFKAVNDGAGHDAGDELLRHIATFLESAVQDGLSFRPAPGKLNIAARIGGDEFVQVVNGVHTEEEAARLAAKLLEDFTRLPIDKYIEKYRVGLSIGVAMFPQHTDDFHVLIKYADVAMYHAKNGGKNNFRMYSDDMSDTVVE